ncbi:MAG: amidase [Proteobacteria bacterium]|nr:amidase [Pseudomonadota bacterium]
MMLSRVPLCAALVSGLALASCSKEESQKPYDVTEVSLAQISADLAANKATSAQVTQGYIDRINMYDGALNAIILVAPDALEQAAASDQRRAEGKTLGPLDGVPVILKDNIDAVGTPTTAGSFALAENFPREDAEVTRRLKQAGAIILAKANLSQWAGYRTTDSFAGSSVGGTPHNPYDLTKSAAGSSSGSGIAVAVSFGAGALGTDTAGSITGPSNVNGIVGLRPTRGLVSRSGIVPITEFQDTAGPMARSVTDTAMLLTALVGTDSADARTMNADGHRTDYVKMLDAKALKGARIGVLRGSQKRGDEALAVFNTALDVLRAQGAELVELPGDLENLNVPGLEAEAYNFNHDVAAYLAAAPEAVKTRNVADLIAFHKTDPRESSINVQYFEEAAAASSDLTTPRYLELIEMVERRAGPEGYGALLAQNNITAIVTPAGDPAGAIPADGTPRTGGRGDGPGSVTRNVAMAGYPLLTVPMGLVGGMPMGLSFIGAPWSEATLLSYGYAYEQAGYKRVPPEAYKAGVQKPGN